MVPLILALDDPEYEDRMAEWMLVHPECGFQPMISGKAGNACLHAEGADSALLVLSQFPQEESGNTATALLTLCLMGKRGSFSDSPTDGVLKYQPLPDLFREIRALASERGWAIRNQERSGLTPVTVVIHLSGASHMQPAAPALALMQARKAGALYLNLDPAGHTEAWFKTTGGHGLSRLAYHVRNIRNGWEERFLNCLFLDSVTGVHALKEPDLPEDACGFGADEVAEIQRVSFRTGFGSLVVDAGLGLDRRNLDLLAVADRVVLLCGSDSPGLRKAASADRILNGVPPGRFRESAEIHWFFCGTCRSGERSGFPKNQMVHHLPDAYPDGFPMDGWNMNPAFMEGISVLGLPLPKTGKSSEVAG